MISIAYPPLWLYYDDTELNGKQHGSRRAVAPKKKREVLAPKVLNSEDAAAELKTIRLRLRELEEKTATLHSEEGAGAAEGAYH